MNVRERNHVLSYIPGFDASKGERINKALQRLWAKIQHLEQTRISERQSQSKDEQAIEHKEDLVMTDLKFMLLALQLKYARSLLPKKCSSTNAASDGVASSDQVDNFCQKNRENSCGVTPLESVFPSVCQETQTGNSLIEGIDFPTSDRNSIVTPAQVSSGVFSGQFGDDQQSRTSSYRALSSNIKPHYHLKLDDVPFILGASSTASHSVVANLQNIIAMMKTHNKALCGPRYSHRTPAPKHQSVAEDTQDASKMLNKLTQELQELAEKQKKLDQQFDSAQKKTHTSANPKDDRDVMNPNKGAYSSKGLKRSSDATKLQAETNFKALHGGQGQRQGSKNSSGNLSIMARRKLLRSLQNFKSHLTEEDITWK